MTELLQEMDNDGVKLPEKQVRVMYLIRGSGGEIDVREQLRLNSGKWGSGKAVSWNRYITGGLDCMDETDKIILE